MSDLLLDELPTRWHGYEIIPDFRPMVWLVNTYVRGQTGDDPIGFAVSALWRFYKDAHCFLNDPQKIIDAYGYMIEFYKAGEKAAESAAAESSTAPSSPGTSDSGDFLMPTDCFVLCTLASTLRFGPC